MLMSDKLMYRRLTFCSWHTIKLLWWWWWWGSRNIVESWRRFALAFLQICFAGLRVPYPPRLRLCPPTTHYSHRRPRWQHVVHGGATVWLLVTVLLDEL